MFYYSTGYCVLCIVNIFTMNCIVLHCSASTVRCEWFHYGLKALCLEMDTWGLSKPIARGHCFAVFLGQQLGLRALFSLSKTIGSELVARPNTIGYDCQTRPKTFLKRTTSIRSCCPPGPHSVGSRSTRPKTLQK